MFTLGIKDYKLEKEQQQQQQQKKPKVNRRKINHKDQSRNK